MRKHFRFDFSIFIMGVLPALKFETYWGEDTIKGDRGSRSPLGRVRLRDVAAACCI